MTEATRPDIAREELDRLIESGEGEAVQAFVYLLRPGDVPYVISMLGEDRRTQMLEMIEPEFAADLMEHFSDEQAADLIEELPTQAAAAIFDELDSDDQADILSELDDDDAEAILEKMDPEEAADARALVRYDPETAGGLMQTEFLTFRETDSVADVVRILRHRAEEYEDYDVRYIYVTNASRVLEGVVRLRQLVLASDATQLTRLMKRDPITVGTTTPLEELEDIFDHHIFTALPVIDSNNRLVGVVQSVAVEEALTEQLEDDYRKLAGLVAGEEVRTMPLGERTLGRLKYLLPSMVLLLVSAVVIAFFEESVLAVIPAMGIFLPVVGGLCGSSGNQAVAVTLREQALGLVREGDVARVFMKEILLGLINGLVLGITLFLVCAVWRGDPYMGLAIGGAIPVAMVVAVTVGGVIPLILRSAKVDPAMAAGPIVTTVVDFASFAVVLTIAYLLIQSNLLGAGG